MATQPDARPPLPRTLGPYTIRQRLAVGGMSEVYLADLPQAHGAHRTVVVKRMLPRIAEDPALRQMFSDEGTLGVQIRHPNVVEMLESLALDDGQALLVMEYVCGVDLWRLGRWLTRTGNRLTPDAAIFVATQMLYGLHAVHEVRDDAGQRLEVVHRDVSPSNVLLSIHGQIKLSDLGIAQAVMREHFPQVDPGARAKGKLGYMAPEQVRGLASDRRSDVFSAGVVVAELLMGRPLFAGGSELAVLLAIRDSKIHPFLEFAKELPDHIAHSVIASLSASPEDRPPNALDFAERLLGGLDLDVVQQQQTLAAHVRAALADGGTTHTAAPLSPTRALADPRAALDEWSDEQPTDDRRAPGAMTANTHYDVLTVAGQQLGPWPLATVVQAVSTGQLGPFDRVSVDGSSLRLLNDIPELSRHVPVSTLTTAQRGEGMVQSEAHVSMQDGGFVGVLAHAAVTGFTGLLLCENQGVRKEVYLHAGSPTFVTSNQASELLGEHLVARGVIDRAELDMALAVMPRYEGRLGDTLSALGLVDPVLLFRHIGEQVREKLLDLFLWPDGSCHQYLDVTPPEISFPLDLQPWDILDEGITWRLMKGLEDVPLRRAESTLAKRAARTRDPSLDEALPAEAAKMLRALGKAKKPATLWQKEEDSARRGHLQRTLLLLLHMNAVRFLD